MKIGIIENSQFFGRTFWEFLEIITEVGIKHIQLPCRPGTSWTRGYVGTDPFYGSPELCIFPIEYADPTTMRPSMEFKEKIETYGVTVTSFYHNCEWLASLHRGDSVLDNEADRIMELCDIAVQWEVPVMRCSEGPVERYKRGETVAGHGDYDKLIRDFSKRTCQRQIRKGIGRCIKYAEDTGVYLALENHGRLLNDATELADMITSFGSEYLGANVDTGNFTGAGTLPNTLKRYYKIIAPYTYSTHIKDKKRLWDAQHPPPMRARARRAVDCPLGEGDAEINVFIDELKKNRRFNEIGTLNIQQERSWDPRVSRLDMLKKSYAYLTSLL